MRRGRGTGRAPGRLQLHGGYGFTRGLPLERYVRILRIYEGASEIQRTVIARGVLAGA